jgi:gamma-glutamyltranspeptidase/glutathione hydrolase
MRKYPVVMVVLLSLIPSPAQAKEGTRFREAVTSTEGVVASISDYASAVGVDVLDRGGNAIDAAVAMVFAVGVARPDFGGIGGGGFLLYRGADKRTAALDFREESPATPQFDANVLAGPGMHHDTDNCTLPFSSGHRVVGVPGVVAGMETALERYGSGRFTLGELITNGGNNSRPPYAYELARDGFAITWELTHWLFCEQNRLQYYPETRKTYGYNSGAGPNGQPLVQADYARSLLLIAENGAEAFYQDAAFPDPITGLPRDSIARQIVADMTAAEQNASTNPNLLANAARWGGASNDKGFLKLSDFAAYEPIWRTPLKSTYRGHQIIAVPPPASGGVAAIEILNLLEGFPLGSEEFDLNTSLEANADTSWAQSSANHLHLLAEAQKIAWADRHEYLADPDFRYDFDGDGDREPVPTKMLISKGYADQRRGEIDMGTASFGQEPGSLEGMHTNHLSVTDGEGNAVAVTTSLGGPFGSAVVAPGTGFPLGSEMEDFNMREPETANAPGPGKRPRSSQSPTIVVKDGQPVLVVGGSGGGAVPLGVVQMIVNVVDHGLSIAQAMDAERIETCAWTTGTTCSLLTIEAGEGSSTQRIPNAVLAELRSRGHTLNDLGEYPDATVPPILEAVGFNLATGRREAISDPRNEFDASDPTGSTFGQGACGQGRPCGQA